MPSFLHRPPAPFTRYPPGTAAAGVCGLPDTRPLWIDYGTPQLGHLFGRPGVIVAGSGEGYPAQMRARGAQTIHWDMYLNRRVGTPSLYFSRHSCHRCRFGFR